MTIELSKAAADGVLATIERHSGKVADNNWWGDDYWKTTRNKDQLGRSRHGRPEVDRQLQQATIR